MREQRIKGEEAEVSHFCVSMGTEIDGTILCLQLRKKIQEKSKEGTLKVSASENGSAPKRRGRWDQTVEDAFVPAKKVAAGAATPTWGDGDVRFSPVISISNDFLTIFPPFLSFQKTPADHRWDETPHHKGNETPSTPSARMWDPTPAHQTPGRQGGAETPAHEKSTRRNRWDETPKTERETPGHNSGWAETPRTDRIEADKTIDSGTPGTASKRRSRWDEMTPSMTTPSGMGATPQMTPSMTPGATPGHATPLLTPGGKFILFVIS